MRAFAAKHGATVAIVALLVLNVVLIVPLVTNRQRLPNDTAAVGSPTVGQTVMPSPPPDSSSPSPSAERSSPAPKLTSGKPRRLLALNSDQVAWRAKASACGQASKIEYTTDGGQTWQATDSGLTGVVRLRAFGDSSVFAIGADGNCNPVYAVDPYPGGRWQEDSSMLSETWFRLPGDLNTVHDPQDHTSKPCGSAGLVDFAGQDDTKGAALCSDRSVRTRVGGGAWQTTIQGSDVVALNADDNHFVMVEQNSRCDGLVVQRFNVHAHRLRRLDKAHCFKGSDSKLDDVAVSNQQTNVWLWSGGVKRTS